MNFSKNILLCCGLLAFAQTFVMPLVGFPTPIQLPLNLQLPDDPFWREDAQEANNNINHFIEPSNTLNYSEYHYIGSHNAHVYHRFFQVVRQQDQTILGQLSYGIRGFMIDAYDFNLSKPAALRGPKGAKVCLSHGEPGFIAFTQKGHNSYQSLQYELRRIIEFMKYSPQAIVTICIEDYANLEQIVAEIKAVIFAANYDPILKPTDWPNAQNQALQKWPTLGWMRENNKRLIIFTQKGGTSSMTWKQYHYCIENQYSTVNREELCRERDESQKYASLPRKNVIFNHFRGIAVTQSVLSTKEQADYNNAKELIEFCQQKGFAQGKICNGYYIDRVIDSCNLLEERQHQTVFDLVNALNKKL